MAATTKVMLPRAVIAPTSAGEGARLRDAQSEVTLTTGYEDRPVEAFNLAFGRVVHLVVCDFVI
jgi:hypothetical protein